MRMTTSGERIRSTRLRGLTFATESLIACTSKSVEQHRIGKAHRLRFTPALEIGQIDEHQALHEMRANQRALRSLDKKAGYAGRNGKRQRAV
jgi:hypothetical protein